MYPVGNRQRQQFGGHLKQYVTMLGRVKLQLYFMHVHGNRVGSLRRYRCGRDVVHDITSLLPVPYFVAVPLSPRRADCGGCHPPLFSGSRRSSSIESYPQCSQPTFIAPAGRNAALQTAIVVSRQMFSLVSCCGRCWMFLWSACAGSVVSTTACLLEAPPKAKLARHKPDKTPSCLTP